MAKRLKEAKLAIKEKDFATAEAACNVLNLTMPVFLCDFLQIA